MSRHLEHKARIELWCTPELDVQRSLASESNMSEQDRKHKSANMRVRVVHKITSSLLPEGGSMLSTIQYQF